MKYGFIRVAAAIPRVGVADVRHNVNEIERQMREAAENQVEIVVFPEFLTPQTATTFCISVPFQCSTRSKAPTSSLDWSERRRQRASGASALKDISMQFCLSLISEYDRSRFLLRRRPFDARYFYHHVFTNLRRDRRDGQIS